MEVQVSSKDLVCSFPAEDHLEAHGFDAAGQ